MKVALINGSPHATGCTATALEEIARELNSLGVDSEMIQVGHLALHGCIACGSCRNNGVCVFDDIVNQTLAKLAEIDAIIVGSPVYYASANGTLIAFLDRLFYAGSAKLAHKPAAAIASARRAGTSVTIDELLKYFTINQMPIVSSTYWPMIHGNTKEEALQDEEGLQTMRNLAKNMAWLLQCIEAGKQTGILPLQAEKDKHTNFIR